MKDLRSVHFHEVRETITGNRLKVYEALLIRGPSTCSELARFLSWDVTSVRPRVTELEQAFHAVATGARREKEHEFRGLTGEEALTLHESARHSFTLEDRRQDRARQDELSQAGATLASARKGTPVAVGQAELFPV